MTRYWKYKGGETYAFEDDHDFTFPESYTEVRVVPLDSVVIDGPLPEVTVRGNDAVADGYYYYLREHPPVDEAQVKALAEDLMDDPNWSGVLTADGAARHLIARGWTKGGDPR